MAVSLPELRDTLPRAMQVPLRGQGWLWLGLFGAVWTLAAVLGGAWGLAIRCAALGLLAEWAAGCYVAGLRGTGRSPALRIPRDWTGRLVWPALTLSVLTFVLWSPTAIIGMTTAVNAMARTDIYGGQSAWDFVRPEPGLWTVAGVFALLAVCYWPLAIVRLATTGHAWSPFDAYEIYGQMREYGWRYFVVAALGLVVVLAMAGLWVRGGAGWTAGWIVGPLGLTWVTGAQSYLIGVWEAWTSEID